MGRFSPNTLDLDGKVILVTGGTGSFGRRFVECRDARKVKADPGFIALREEVLQLIHSTLPQHEPEVV